MKSNCGPSVFFGTFVTFGRRSVTRDNVYGEAFAGLETFEDYIEAKNDGNTQIRSFSNKDITVHPSKGIQMRNTLRLKIRIFDLDGLRCFESKNF